MVQSMEKVKGSIAHNPAFGLQENNNPGNGLVFTDARPIEEKAQAVSDDSFKAQAEKERIERAATTNRTARLVYRLEEEITEKPDDAPGDEKDKAKSGFKPKQYELSAGEVVKAIEAKNNIKALATALAVAGEFQFADFTLIARAEGKAARVIAFRADGTLQLDKRAFKDESLLATYSAVYSEAIDASANQASSAQAEATSQDAPTSEPDNQENLPFEQVDEEIN